MTQVISRYEKLRELMTGPVFGPGDTDYDNAR